MLTKQKYNSYCDENQKTVYQKMPNNSWLRDEMTCKNFMLWVTFWRRNMHRCATDYLGFKLYWYQYILLYFMGHCVDVCAIGARAVAKSLILAMYAVVRCVLYPGTEFVITANRQRQAKLILTEKIEGLLMQRSPVLRREIKSISTNDRDLSCKFRNGSKIIFVICNEDSRGFRSTANGVEEAREINKTKYDTIVSPFKVTRNVPFLMSEEYKNAKELLEQPQTIMISSSISDKHWLYKYALDTAKGMIGGKSAVFLAFDISVTLEHGIRTVEQLEEEKSKIDPISWTVEYENAVLRENTNAFFSYELVVENQRLSHAFYPKGNQSIQAQGQLRRQNGEIRIVAGDLAFVNRKGNDRSSFSCIRMLPENDGSIYTYRLQVPYMESFMGQETSKQALRIRQLYEDFEADYIVLDTRNNGVAVYEALARTMYDGERGKEYSPLKCFNDEEFASRIVVPDAKPVIYCVFASQKKNSDAAYTLHSLFREHKIDLLISRREAVDVLSGLYPEYRDGDPEKQLCYEGPFIEADFAVGEITNLEVERLDTTGVLKIKERAGNLKDRYSSLSMGCHFAVDLARDISNAEEIELDTDIDCVSEINFDVRW